MDFIIQKLTLSDEPSLIDFVNKQSKEDLKFFRRWNKLNQSREKLVRTDCTISFLNGERIVAKTPSDKIMGFGLVDFFEESEKKHISVVGTIVDKEFRGLGLGKKLLENEIQISKKRKINKIRSTIHENNINSVKLHQSLGFHIEGTFVNEEFHKKFQNVLSLALFID